MKSNSDVSTYYRVVMYIEKSLPAASEGMEMIATIDKVVALRNASGLNA